MINKLARVPNVSLRPVTPSDLEVLFSHQSDQVAYQLAQFTPRDREAFFIHWQQNVLGQDNVLVRAIEVDGRLVGNICQWYMNGVAFIGYWIDRAFWGRGVATLTLSAFLPQVDSRPLFAHVAQHNVASQRVLQYHGFMKTGVLVQEESDMKPLIEFVLF